MSNYRNIVRDATDWPVLNTDTKEPIPEDIKNRIEAAVAGILYNDGPTSLWMIHDLVTKRWDDRVTDFFRNRPLFDWRYAVIERACRAVGEQVWRIK